jgi:shikimate dehydrogenase
VIGGRTALYGIVGWPVGHSLSPAMQNAAFAFLGLDAAYLALPVEPGSLETALQGAHALGFQGLNVTIPHKQAAAAACLALDPVATACGAANTLRRTPAGWEGFNTDATALSQLLDGAGVRAGATALLLGAGGAARAGGWAALKVGARLRVAARRRDQAEALCTALGGAVRPGGTKPEVVGWESLAAASRAADVVMNGTSVGLAGQPAALPGLGFRAGQVALDMVYGDTAFTRDAVAAGARLVRGEELLVRQGALAFNLWTGRPAPEAAMVAALQAARKANHP